VSWEANDSPTYMCSNSLITDFATAPPKESPSDKAHLGQVRVQPYMYTCTISPKGLTKHHSLLCIYAPPGSAQNQFVCHHKPGVKWVLCVPKLLCSCRDLSNVRISNQLIPRVIGRCFTPVSQSLRSTLPFRFQLFKSRLPDQTAYFAM